MKNFLANKKGLYRITFSVCIFFLSLLTVVITSNYNERDAQTLSEDRVEESVKFNDEKKQFKNRKFKNWRSTF